MKGQNRPPHGINGNETETKGSKKRYREKHPEIFRKQKRRYRKKHPEVIRDQNRRYRQKNREKLTEIKRKKYREAHPEGFRKHKKKQRFDVLKKKLPLKESTSIKGQWRANAQCYNIHQTRAGGTVIMSNEHFLF